jgi:ATP-dependent DNA helicase DinG
MPTSDPILEILGPEGSLVRSLRDFEHRPSQIEMAHLIGLAIEEERSAFIEAGTGTGKTIGYLVPIILSGKKAVISTGTKNLQEQIYHKDIPILADAAGLRVDAVIMKGRKNYLCLHRYHQYLSRLPLTDKGNVFWKERIEGWLKETTFADRSELSWMPDDSPIWDAVSTTSDQCLGAECTHFEDCYLNALRRRAVKARIIIVNHHLFFADLMVKRHGFGEILPRYQVLLFDEAHNIEAIATTYFGERLSSLQLLELVQDMEREAEDTVHSRKEAFRLSLNRIRTGLEKMVACFQGRPEKGRLDQETVREIYQGPAREIKKALTDLDELLGVRDATTAPCAALSARLGEFHHRLDRILGADDPNLFIWYEKRQRSLLLHASPLEISGALEEQLYSKVNRVIFTSATLSANGTFDYIRSRLGPSGPSLEGILPSHFHFESQTLLYIAMDLPSPDDSVFAERVAERVSEILRITSGRALVLFTSHHNLNLVHQRLAGKTDYALYRQGDAPRSTLLEEFKHDTHSVLLATGSFWQGVDVPGEALSCLVIDKLPFDSPADPLVAARIKSIQSRGGNPFMEYQIPSAVIALKQGLGRLIRKSSDCGVLSILDRRIIRRSYGKLFLDSLPQMPISHELSDIALFFQKRA